MIKWTLTLSVLCIFLSCSSNKKVSEQISTVIPGTPAPAIEVDGKGSDWASVPLTTNPDGTIQYGVVNNAHQLYIFMKIADPAEQQKLIFGGMEIWFDPSDKEQKKTAVVYPVKGEISQSEIFAKNESGAPLSKEQIRQRISLQLISLNRTGFLPDFNGVQSIHQPTGFKGAIGWDANDDLIYELVIPLRAIPQDHPFNQLQVGFFIHGLERPKQGPSENGGNWGAQGMNHEGMGRHNGGGFGGRGGGNYRGGENRSASSRGAQKMFQDEHFWVVYKLAGKQGV
jgi:hypothetical protein